MHEARSLDQTSCGQCELRIYDPDGEVDMTVTTPLKGYPHLKVGDVVKGRLFDIKHKWVKFNGHVPHATVPEGDEGGRIAFRWRLGIRIEPVCGGA